MSRRQKLERFEAIGNMSHVFQNFTYDPPKLIDGKGEAVDMAGKWTRHFERDAPLVLELACGRGEYCLGLAELYPENNYIGVDIKGARIHQGAVRAEQTNLSQIAFLRTKIEYIDCFFGKEEVDTIWIIFPDPFLKTHKANRRLTSPQFMSRYRNILKKHGSVKLKTDSPELYEYTLEVVNNDNEIKILNQIEDLHRASHELPELNIITYYERMHLAKGRKINYIEFSLNS